MTTRIDSWTEEHDRLLAETVLRHVREGSTQLKAFDEAAEAMNRTGAACGYRWNTALRKKHAKALAEAKRERRRSYLHGADLSIDAELVMSLMYYAGQTGRTATDVAEEAIRNYLEGVGAK